MKIRLGLVSNSSTSTFIVKGLTTAQVAKLMLELRRDELYDDLSTFKDKQDKVWTKKCIEKINIALKILNKDLTYKLPISFPWTINYPTSIWIGGYKDVVVKTCNNHLWQDINWNNYGGAFIPLNSSFDDLNEPSNKMFRKLALEVKNYKKRRMLQNEKKYLPHNHN